MRSQHRILCLLFEKFIEDPTRLLGGVMLLTGASVSTAFTPLLSFPLMTVFFGIITYKRKCQKKRKNNNANNANTAMCLQASPFSRTDLFLLLALASQPCLVQITEWDFFPHHTWAHAGLLPPMLLPPMPWESLVILSRGRGSGFSFCGISILHTPARQIKSSSGIKKSCAS